MSTAYSGPLALNTSGLDQNALGGGLPVELNGFVPVVTGAVTWGTNIVFTDASTFPGSDSLKNINITISDQHGNEVKGAITSGSGTATLATTDAELVQTDDWDVKVTVTSVEGCIADGFIKVPVDATACTLANYSISFTTSK